MTFQDMILSGAGLLVLGAAAFMWHNFLSLRNDTYRKSETEQLIDLKTAPLAVSLQHLAEALHSLTATLAELHHDVIYMKGRNEQEERQSNTR